MKKKRTLHTEQTFLAYLLYVFWYPLQYRCFFDVVVVFGGCNRSGGYITTSSPISVLLLYFLKANITNENGLIFCVIGKRKTKIPKQTLENVKISDDRAVNYEKNDKIICKT